MQEQKKRWTLILLAVMLAAAVLAGISGNWKQDVAAGNKNYVAVIRIDGPIYGGEGSDSVWESASGTASEQLMKEFRQAREDPHARAVLVRINSPGGSSAATQEVAEEMDRIRTAGKPIVISMGDTCASAGYWLASKGDYIFANPSTITGSIGVYMDYTNVEDLMDKLGIKNDKIKSGAHKDILSMYRPMTAEERAMLQAMVDDIYRQFVRVVADGRHMDEQAVMKLADGRVFTGRQAQELGLVDAMGNYYDALAYAGGRAGMEGPNVPVKVYGQKAGWRGLLSSEAQDAFADSLAGHLADRISDMSSQAPSAVVK